MRRTHLPGTRDTRIAELGLLLGSLGRVARWAEGLDDVCFHPSSNLISKRVSFYGHADVRGCIQQISSK